MTYQQPALIKISAILALLAILFGFALGGVFGGMEDAVKGKLSADGKAALTTTYQGDEAAMEKTVTKSFTYLKRAHMHGGAIGTAALAIIATLVLLTGLGKLAQASALAVSLGSVLYPLFWLLAGFAAPSLGSTDAAKQAYEWLAVPGAGLSLLGVLGALIAVATNPRK